MAKKTQKNKTQTNITVELEYDQFMKALDNGPPDGTNYISEQPTFSELCELHDDIKALRDRLISLAEGHDVPQRATDLLWGALSFAQKVAELVTLEPYEEQ